MFFNAIIDMYYYHIYHLSSLLMFLVILNDCYSVNISYGIGLCGTTLLTFRMLPITFISDYYVKKLSSKCNIQHLSCKCIE